MQIFDLHDVKCVPYAHVLRSSFRITVLKPKKGKTPLYDLSPTFTAHRNRHDPAPSGHLQAAPPLSSQPAVTTLIKSSQSPLTRSKSLLDRLYEKAAGGVVDSSKG